MKGTIKWFNRDKGYGFIQGEDGQEYFVHYTNVEKGTFLRDNDEVSFEPADSDRGKQAKDVKLTRKGSDIPEGEKEEPEEKEEETKEEEPEEEA